MSPSRYLIDGFPRSFENWEGWQKAASGGSASGREGRQEAARTRCRHRAKQTPRAMNSTDSCMGALITVDGEYFASGNARVAPPP